MKIVFDTNILISAFLTTAGPSQHVFSAALKRHTVILSEYILKEFSEKLVNKLEIPRRQVLQAADFLRKKTIILNVPETAKATFSDKKDIPLLSLLEAAKPHYFVTGDKKLLALKKHGPTLFLTPRETMEIIEGSPHS